MAESAYLKVDVDHQQGTLHLKMGFELTNDWTVLFGPSGSGKSTLLRIVAGLIKPRSGLVEYGNTVLVDSSRRIFVPAYRRPIRGAGQAAWLLPRSTVAECLLAGANRSSGAKAQDNLFNEILEVFQLKLLVNKSSNRLSGGERQRVSVASAIVAAATYQGSTRPLLLLDEPFAGLGREVRDSIAVELRERLRRWKIPVLSVSHDVTECFLLRAEVIRIADGRILAQGRADEVLADERRRILIELDA